MAFLVVFLVVFAIFSYNSQKDRERTEQRQQEYFRRKAETAEKQLEAVHKTAEDVNACLDKNDIDGAVLALSMCHVSGLSDALADNGDATTLYTSEIANVVNAYIGKGQKKKAQELLVSCSSKYKFGRTGLSDLFTKLGADGNFLFKGEDGYNPR